MATVQFWAALVFWCFALTVARSAPIPHETRSLWPAPPAESNELQPVDVVLSSEPRDSAVFAGIVAYSAAVRLITAELPLSGSGKLILAAFFFAAAIPTVLASLLALIIPSERSFSWIWAQLIMPVALLGVFLSVSCYPIETTDRMDSQHEEVPLR